MAKREGMFKKSSSSPILSEVEGKATVGVTRGAYAAYVSANAAKSGKSVSPKVGNTVRTPLACLRAARTGRRLFSTFPQYEFSRNPVSRRVAS